MQYDDRKIDVNFSQRVTEFASTDELNEDQRVHPWPLPSTHVFEYRYEDRATGKRPNALPVRIEGPRELSLAEIVERSNNFEMLSLSELRWLIERYHVAQAPPVKGAPRGDEVTALREAMRAHVAKAKPEKPLTAVKAEAHTADDDDPKPVLTLPPDIAAMNEAQLKTLSATLEVYEEFKKHGGRSLASRRAWLASKRLEKEAPNPPAVPPEKVVSDEGKAAE